MSFIKRKHIILIFCYFYLFFLQIAKKIKIVGHGIFYLENRESLLKLKTTNKNDVISLLGRPHSKSIEDKNTWIYIERTKTRGKIHTLGRDVLLNNNVLVLRFSKYGLLEEKLFYKKENMNDYKFAKAETKNEIRRGSFLRSFMNSIRSKMQKRK